MIRADTVDEARQKAEEIGKSRAHSYENGYGKQVRWEYREVLDLSELVEEPRGEGSEVYWTFLNFIIILGQKLTIL